MVLEPKPSLVGMTREEIQIAMGDRKDAKLRSKQLALRLYQKAEDDILSMSDLPEALRVELADKFQAQPLTVASQRHSLDDVDKLLVHNGDNQVYECVLLPYPDRVSCCISSQVGCPMGCKFCATGLGGFDRNLTVGEIVGQYLLLQRMSERRISNVVFMGMGEPLLNLPAVIQSLRLMHEEIGLSYRHLTVSTVGLVPQIYDLAKELMPIHLALSLHSPIDSVRDKLMPVNHKYPVAEVMQAMRDYQRSTGRKVTLEYLLIKDVTDTSEQAVELARLVRGLPCLVNLIPFNYVDTEQGFARPDKARVREFWQILANRGVNATERMERGHDIGAACGQLAGQHEGRKARANRREQLPALPQLS